MVEDYKKLVEKIVNERKLCNIFQNEMAAALNIDERTYREKEKGNSNFSLIEFLIICKRLNRPPAFFFESLNLAVFNNCNYSGNNNKYDVNEMGKETLKVIIDALSEKLDTIKSK
jgi:DNA-binding XRE family transcriptional regulator